MDGYTTPVKQIQVELNDEELKEHARLLKEELLKAREAAREAARLARLQDQNNNPYNFNGIPNDGGDF